MKPIVSKDPLTSKWTEKMELPSISFNTLTKLGLPLDINYEIDDLRCQLYRGVHGHPAVQMPNNRKFGQSNEVIIKYRPPTLIF